MSFETNLDYFMTSFLLYSLNRMKILSVNLGERKAVNWRGKTIFTGMFKLPVDNPIFLSHEDVDGDHVVDRRYHGGFDKACYLYASEAYIFWTQEYPKLKLTSGFFGENITVEGLDETEINIGDQYIVGEAIIEISQSRQPCFKLGIRFETQKIIKQFINAPYPGIYIRVLKPGKVSASDRMILHKKRLDEPTVLEIFQMIYGINKNKALIKKALDSIFLADSAKKAIRKRLKINLIKPKL